MKALLVVGVCLATALGSGLAMAEPSPTPNPDPWIQGQIDSLTEDVPGYLSSINRSGVNRSGISDTDLVIKGHLICDAIYAHRGDVSMGRLPNVRNDDYHSMEVVAGASIKYLCPPAAAYAGPNLVQAAP